MGTVGYNWGFRVQGLVFGVYGFRIRDRGLGSERRLQLMLCLNQRRTHFDFTCGR